MVTDAISMNGDIKTGTTNGQPDIKTDNPINTLLSSLAVLPSAEQAFNLDPTVLSQNGSAFLGVLADLQSNIKSIDNLAFACSPISVLEKSTLPPLPSSLFKTPLRDRKRIREVQEQESRLLNTGLNVKPRLRMVPPVPSQLRDELQIHDAWSDRVHLQTALDRLRELNEAQGSEKSVKLEIADWQESPQAGRPASAPNTAIANSKRLTVCLKINMGLPTGLWGYVCFARRKRRYEGRYNNREGGDGMALAKRLKRDVRPEDEKNSDEDVEGDTVIATRFHLFSEVETNKAQNDLSDFRWIQELCVHLNHLELSLAEFLHRLPAYSSIMQENCFLCSSLLKRGVPPVKRAFLPTSEVSDTTDATQAGQNISVQNADTREQSTSTDQVTQASNDAIDLGDSLKGQWVAFHSACS